jgi:hypothetical protein
MSEKIWSTIANVTIDFDEFIPFNFYEFEDELLGDNEVAAHFVMSINGDIEPFKDSNILNVMGDPIGLYNMKTVIKDYFEAPNPVREFEFLMEKQAGDEWVCIDVKIEEPDKYEITE